MLRLFFHSQLQLGFAQALVAALSALMVIVLALPVPPTIGKIPRVVLILPENVPLASVRSIVKGMVSCALFVAVPS